MLKELNIDKSKWKLTKLGELAEEISSRVDNPSTSKYERFVGLDCFVSGELKIKKWSTTDNVNSSAKAFQSGDVLFARRNAYLKRASLIEFDGCCSGDAFVLRENHDKIVHGFLSFIVNSEKLWAFANSNAEGTMSKRVKWRDLANYEFLLPPKDQQAELAELLWAMDEVIEKDLEVLKRLEESTKVLFNSIYKDKSLIYKKLKDVLLNTQYGISNQLYDKGELPVLRMNNLLNGQIDFKDLKYINKSEIDLENYLLKEGDILFNRTNSFELVGKVSLFSLDSNYTFASYLVRLKCNTDIIDPRYLNLYLNSEQGKENVRQYRSPGVNQSNISPSNLIKLSIPVIDINNQRIISEYVYNYKAIISQMESKLSSSKSLQKSLINQIF
ncbi:restriction endonuclease subunit S [Elizabethkingia anophelis]|nr:restriction endonuclease subunit S [Elizabethkingia anophelis]MCT4301957.1 restriction endonuclease subunit S [Elizabethkingia anophelis]